MTMGWLVTWLGKPQVEFTNKSTDVGWLTTICVTAGWFETDASLQQYWLMQVFSSIAPAWLCLATLEIQICCCTGISWAELSFYPLQLPHTLISALSSHRMARLSLAAGLSHVFEGSSETWVLFDHNPITPLKHLGGQKCIFSMMLLCFSWQCGSFSWFFHEGWIWPESGSVKEGNQLCRGWGSLANRPLQPLLG